MSAFCLLETSLRPYQFVRKFVIEPFSISFVWETMGSFESSLNPYNVTVLPATRPRNPSTTSSDSFGTDETDFGVLPEESLCFGNSLSKGSVTLTSKHNC